MTHYTCPTCGDECELCGDSMKELSVWCEKCDREIIGELSHDVYADWYSDQIDRAMDYMEDR